VCVISVVLVRATCRPVLLRSLSLHHPARDETRDEGKNGRFLSLLSSPKSTRERRKGGHTAHSGRAAAQKRCWLAACRPAPFRPSGGALDSQEFHSKACSSSPLASFPAHILPSPSSLPPTPASLADSASLARRWIRSSGKGSGACPSVLLPGRVCLDLVARCGVVGLAQCFLVSCCPPDH
jgi:hypothetical protein